MTDIIRIKDQLRLLCRDWRRANSYIDTEGRIIMPEYPKAMMNNRQVELGTATINCGCDRPENRLKAHEIIASQAFREYLNRCGVRFGGIEHTPGSVQIRLRYDHPERKHLPEV